MKLTEELIRAGLTKGVGLSDGQARFLNIRSRKGWLKALIGTEMSEKDYRTFLNIGEKNRGKKAQNFKQKKKGGKRKKKKYDYKIQSDEFLKSYPWRKLRLQVLLKYGRKCQCCGATPPEVVIHVDHIKPRKLYPELALEISNLQVLCHECNHGKGNWNETDFRPDDELSARFKEITKQDT